MGDTIQQWRATIGLWSGGRPRNCVILRHHIAQSSNHIGYKYIRFLVLVSLLIIGCVELNPGPNNENSATTQKAGALPKFHRRPGTVGLQGELYGLKMAAFLFARGLYKTEEFELASNLDGVGNFDDLVFRYRLRESDVWKTCFIQLKHKRNGGTIKRTSLTQMSGDFSLLKHFKSYCEIKTNAAKHPTLKHCGPFDDFEFVIYTNEKMETNSLHPVVDCALVNLLSSGKDYQMYKCFDESSDEDIFKFFEELRQHDEHVRELDSLLKSRASVDKKINAKIMVLQNSFTNEAILNNLSSLKSAMSTQYVTTWIDELAKCDFNLFKEFLSKVKILHTQANEVSFEMLIKKELQEACKASPSVANFIYKNFEEGFSKWWKKGGNVVWLNQNSYPWQTVQKHIITEIKEISKREIEENNGCSISFNSQHVQKLSDAIKQNVVLNIVTNSNNCILQKFKTYQALNNLGHTNSLFISIKSLMTPRKEINKLWPCKWSDVIVVDCGSDGNVADIVLDILQQCAVCEKYLDNSDDNTAKNLVEVLQKYQQKLILISLRQIASGVQEKLGNISHFEDNCNISDFDQKVQKQILELPVNFQGTNVALSTLVGTDPPQNIKDLLDSDVISILLSNELSVGTELGKRPKYYVKRALQHHIYLKKDILKLTDREITFAVSGLRADELKKYLPAGEEICEFVYDERERNHKFKIVSDFSKTDLSAGCGTVKSHQQLGQKIQSDDFGNSNFRGKNPRIDGSEVSKSNSCNIDATFSKTSLDAELKNTKVYNESFQNTKPEEIRYTILGNKNPEIEFRELKELCRNVHWINVEEGFFLWRDTNGSIDIIRRYIDCERGKEYDTKIVAEHNDSTMLLVAEPGMGKSTFLSYMTHKIKKWKPSVWVLRINLNEYTKELEEFEFEQECIDKCKKFLWNAAHLLKQDALYVTEKVFFHAMEQTGNMVIILDGFDEISQYYGPKVKMFIREIRDRTTSKIWISSRFSCRKDLEDVVGKFAFTLQPFTPQNQMQFLEKYWSEVTEISNQRNLQMFAKKLLKLCSKNFSDKDGKFTGIPLQTMMLGEAFVNEVKEYCCSGKFNSTEKFNLVSLFTKFTENKFDIYFREKIKMDTLNLEAKSLKKDYIEKHMISALMYLFSPKEIDELRRTITASKLEETNRFLKEGNAQRFGILTDTADGKLHFIHRCFAEYFAGKWLTYQLRGCKEFISKFLFNSTYEVTRNIFDQMLAEDSKIHGSVLNNDTHALKEILKMSGDLNALDKGGRTALHVAASYNSPYIQQLLSFSGTDVNQQDCILEWTPLRYADRTKSWMAMDILLQNGANPDDIVFTRQNAKTQEWGQRALWECASKGHEKLLEFILSCGIEVNASVEVPENSREKFSLLHRASFCGEADIVRFLVNRGADIKMVDANNNTALHLAAASGSVDIIKLLLDKRISVNLCGAHKFTPLHFSAQFGHLEATKTLVERRAAINATNIFGFTPLMLALYSSKLEIFRYLIEIGANISIPKANNDTVLHLASTLGSVDFIKILLDKGIPANVRGSYKCTPLHITAQCGHLEATKALVEKGAAINSSYKYGITPLMMAALYGKLEICRYLTALGADTNIRNENGDTALHVAAQIGSVEIIKLLLDKGASVNMTNKGGFTPLHAYAQLGHLEATKALVERGAAINNISKNGITPLMFAAFHGKLEICLYLTELGADINIRNANTETALYLAAVSGSVEIIKLLLDKGMSVNLANKDGCTPLHVSAQCGHLEATKVLFESGASLKKVNKNGCTPLMMATEIGVINFLKEAENSINKMPISLTNT